MYLSIRMESSNETSLLPTLRTITCFKTICCYFCKKMFLKFPDWIGNRQHILMILSMCKSSAIQIQEIVCYYYGVWET